MGDQWFDVDYTLANQLNRSYVRVRIDKRAANRQFFLENRKRIHRHCHAWVRNAGALARHA